MAEKAQARFRQKPVQPASEGPANSGAPFARLSQQWEELKIKFESAEHNNEALREHVRDLLEVVLKLNTSVVAWKCATMFLLAALTVAIAVALLR